MKKALIALIVLMGFAIALIPKPVAHPTPIVPVWDENYQTTYTASYTSIASENEDLSNVQSPIPMECRVKNVTEKQCVFASLECLGRWADCKELMNPPLTSRSDCKDRSGPYDAAAKLKRLGVKYENVYQDRVKGIELIKRAMAEGRGALWGVPGHAMVLCHYDEEKNVVKWIDNSDESLRIQTTTVDKFKKRWDGWVMVIYANPDIVSVKAGKLNLMNSIPIIDRNGPQGDYPKNYIPTPNK